MEIQVTAKSNNSYSIFANKTYDDLYEKVFELFPNVKKVLIVSDENVFPLYGPTILERLSAKYEVHKFVIPAGESSKSLDNAVSIVKFLKENDFSRADLLVGMGGGVVCDLTGFAASLFHRGVDHILLPTSLLCMADASIGGKTAVDFEGLKNIIGAFKMPSLLYIATDVLKTLPEREYYAGFAEIMKAGLLYDGKFYEWLIENMYEICDKDPVTLDTMLERTINIKKAVVEKDPFDKGDRALLNLGHTIGHAIESHFAGEYLHGEAVALGTVAAAYISWKKEMISMEDYYEVRDMFVPFNLPISIVVDDAAIDDIMNRLKKDKKNTAGSVNMVLLKKIGKAVLVNDIERELILEAIKELNFSDED